MANNSLLKERVFNAFKHVDNDRTPLFEIFWKFHPIYWDICGRNPATDASEYWDALSEGISINELAEYEAMAKYKMADFFGLDIIHVGFNDDSLPFKPQKTGDKKWELNGEEYCFDEKTKLVCKSNYSPEDAFSNKSSEETEIKFIEKNQDAQIKEISPRRLLTLRKLKELALKNNKNFIYMGEIGAGTGAAAYPPFMLMWFLVEPELLCKWIEIKAKQAFYETRTLLEEGCEIIAIGGDVSSDKGPIISPAHYREFILPVIKKHVDIIHSQKAYAVYTSDGNHWDIKEDFFFNSNIDGYKEVDFAAGMTFEKLIKEGVKEKVCIIGNIDARHLLCNGTPQDVRKEVMRCLSLGRETPGGHILHTSHSVHEDVKIENYYAMINAYREFFGLEQLEIQGVL